MKLGLINSAWVQANQPTVYGLQRTKELGFAPEPDSEEAKKPFVEVSGRKGLGVKADDLIDRVIEKALAEVDRRQSELPADERRRIAEQIGVAAVRYFLIKYSRTTIIAFDIDEALSFEGESGPYLQYAVVRANNIFQKLRDRDGLSETDVVAALPSLPPLALVGDEGPGRPWSPVPDAARPRTVPRPGSDGHLVRHPHASSDDGKRPRRRRLSRHRRCAPSAGYEQAVET